MTTPRPLPSDFLDHAIAPQSDAGQAPAARPPLTHGLCGEGIITPDRENEEITRRMREWNEALKPSSGLDFYMLEVVAVESLRLQRCREHERSLLHEQLLRVEESWDADRRLAAAVLARGLAADPDPVALQLRQTAQGCDWLIGGWEYLGRVLAEGGDWSAAQRSHALDLLGVPAARREGPTPLDPAPEGDAIEHRRVVVAAELEQLRGLRQGVLSARDLRERRAAALGLSGELPPGVVQVRRYAATSSRRLDKALDYFRKRGTAVSPPRSLPPGPGSPSPRPIIPPPPAPPSPPPPAAPRPRLDEAGYRARLMASLARQEAPAPPPAPQPEPPTYTAADLAAIKEISAMKEFADMEKYFGPIPEEFLLIDDAPAPTPDRRRRPDLRRLKRRA